MLTLLMYLIAYLLLAVPGAVLVGKCIALARRGDAEAVASYGLELTPDVRQSQPNATELAARAVGAA